MNEYELYHYGVKGMKWGVRRFQKKDGTLTSEGKKQRSRLTDKQKKYIKVGATVAGTALVAYGAYKLHKNGKLDSLINKGSKKTDDLIESFGDTKLAEISRAKVDTVTLNAVPVSSIKTPVNNKVRAVAALSPDGKVTILPENYKPKTSNERLTDYMSSISTYKKGRKIEDLSKGVDLFNKMKKDGINISNELEKNNQFMRYDMDKLEQAIKTSQAVNARRQSAGLKVDDTLAKMELAYLLRQQ